MAYNTEELHEKAMEAAADPNVYFIEDIAALCGCSKETLYKHFPLGSDEMDAIKGQLTQNKIDTKVKLRKRLGDGEKAAEIIALYKLIGTDDERKKLSTNYNELSGKVQTEDVSDKSDEDLKGRLKDIIKDNPDMLSE